MEEWVIDQFARSLDDLGLEKPWYWDTLLTDLSEHHHGQQLGTWSWRPTLWWSPAAGVSPDERDWLEEKYPGWNDTFGRCWDVLTENLVNDNVEKTIPGTLPIICNVSNLPIVGTPNTHLQDYSLEYEGRLYHFGSKVDRWIFEQDPKRYSAHKNLIDRFLTGEIEPMDLGGVLAYMGIGVLSDGGGDALNYQWVESYKQKVAA